MKKLTGKLWSILLTLPMLVGMCFLTPSYAPATLNGGGGANSLNRPETHENPDFSNEKQLGQEWENPTYKSFEEYFTDLNITKDTISAEDYTGKGVLSNPYVVHSTKGFLYLMNSALSGLSLSGKHLELACNVSLNDEKFDDDGKAYGGDGVIYSWQPVRGANSVCINGNGYSISGLYINDPEKDYVSLFDSQVNIAKDLNFEDFYVVGRERVAVLCANQYVTSQIDNVNILNGVVKGIGRVYALCFNAKAIKNCKSYANVYQLEEGAIQEGFSGFISGGANVSIRDCVFYGKIVAYEVGYLGGIAVTVRYGEIVNCKNYGTIEKKTSAKPIGVGGIVGYVTATNVLNCENYGDIKSGYTNNGGICGYTYLESSYFLNCKNYGKLQRAGGIVGYGVSCDLISCENYGTMEGSGSSGLFISLESKNTSKDNVTTIRDCIIDCDFIYNVGSGGIIGTSSWSDLEIIDCTIKADIVGTLPDHYSLIREYNSKYLWRYEGLDVDLNFEVLNNPTFHVIYAVWQDGKIEISNCKMNIHGVNAYWIGSAQGFVKITNLELNMSSKTFCIKISNGTADRITLKNIVINEVVEKKLSNTKILFDAKKSVAYDGIVRKLNAGGDKYFEYYGNDFSGFCVDYKSGRVGLKSLSNKNLFQGKVTEETLKNKGFTKQTL